MDQASASNQDPNGAGAMMDKAFVRKALEGGMTEVQLGQLAAQKSSNPDVKQFGQKMVDDHTKLGDQMKQVAEQMNIKPPDSLSSKDKANVAKLSALDGDAFDKAYIKDMVKDHKSDDNDFKMEAQSTQNPQLKQMVMQSDQTIESHLQQIAKSKGSTQKAKM
jgi:putative membrane protein